MGYGGRVSCQLKPIHYEGSLCIPLYYATLPLFIFLVLLIIFLHFPASFFLPFLSLPLSFYFFLFILSFQLGVVLFWGDRLPLCVCVMYVGNCSSVTIYVYCASLRSSQKSTGKSVAIKPALISRFLLNQLLFWCHMYLIAFKPPGKQQEKM